MIEPMRTPLLPRLISFVWWVAVISTLSFGFFMACMPDATFALKAFHVGNVVMVFHALYVQRMSIAETTASMMTGVLMIIFVITAYYMRSEHDIFSMVGLFAFTVWGTYLFVTALNKRYIEKQVIQEV